MCDLDDGLPHAAWHDDAATEENETVLGQAELVGRNHKTDLKRTWIRSALF